MQRFGSAANLNIHLHGLVLDGVYRCDAYGVPAFVEACAPNDDELHALLKRLNTRLMKLLTRRCGRQLEPAADQLHGGLAQALAVAAGQRSQQPVQIGRKVEGGSYHRITM